jgi:L-fucose mutarotase/ribose pyranase (RbsD/FucU family)
MAQSAICDSSVSFTNIAEFHSVPSRVRFGVTRKHGALTKVVKATVSVRSLDCAVEDEMTFDEIVSTDTLADRVSRQRTGGSSL